MQNIFPTGNQVDDLLTKPVSVCKFKKLIVRPGLRLQRDQKFEVQVKIRRENSICDVCFRIRSGEVFLGFPHPLQQMLDLYVVPS